MTDEISNPEELIRSLPDNTKSVIQLLWKSMNQSEQKKVIDLFSNIPSKPNLIKMLIDMSVLQIKLTFGDKKKIAIVGPANVGKSTLYNQFIRNEVDKAEVTPIPGTTKIKQVADAGIFSVIDTPGVDAIGNQGEKEKNIAFRAAESADFLVVVFDASSGIRTSDRALFKEIVRLQKPYIIVFNKVDLIRKHIKNAIEKAATNLNIQPEQIIPISAKNGENLDKILISIAITEPEITTALGQALPQYRWKLAWRTIISAASISSVISLTPIPVIDFAPLVINQSVMVLGIARIYRYEFTIDRAKELVVTFGIGLLGRTLFSELSKLGGIPGWLLSIAISASTTIAMGYAAVIWFEKGERLSSASIDKITREFTSQIISVLRETGTKKPSKGEIKRRVITALENLKNIDKDQLIRHS